MSEEKFDWAKTAKETGSVTAEFVATPEFRRRVTDAVVAGTAQAIMHTEDFEKLVAELVRDIAKNEAFRKEVSRMAADRVANEIEDRLTRTYDY